MDTSDSVVLEFLGMNLKPLKPQSSPEALITLSPKPRKTAFRRALGAAVPPSSLRATSK